MIKSKENVSRWHHENGSKSNFEDHLECEKKQFWRSLSMEVKAIL
jgi:hypothetical protein